MTSSMKAKLTSFILWNQVQALPDFPGEEKNAIPGVVGVKLFGVAPSNKTKGPTVLVSRLLVHGKILTVTLTIPPGYPSVPPEVRIKGRIPHVNLLVRMRMRMRMTKTCFGWTE